MKRFIPTAAAAAAWLSAAAALAGAVVVPPAAQQRMGLQTTRLSAQRHSTQVDAFAKVLDPEPLVQLDSDLRTAMAAAATSRAEAQRSRALGGAGGGMAAKDVEAAVSQAKQDELKVEMLRRRLSLEWGPGVARLSERRRSELVQALTAGKAALVHVDTHNNLGQAGAREVKVDVGDSSLPGIVLGPARAAESRLQSSGLIVMVSGPKAILLSVGLTQSAHIAQAEARTGVMIPRSAVVRDRGAAWAYVRTGPQRFERRLIDAPVPEEEGLFTASGFQSGDEVVTQGAVALFAAEQGQESVQGLGQSARVD
jgi:hypothetical protein